MSAKIERIESSSQAAWDDVGARSFLRDEVGYEYGDILPMAPGLLKIGTHNDLTHLLATDNGEPVGRLLSQVSPERDGTVTELMRDIAVVPEARRRGVGRILIEEAVRRASTEARVLRCETDLEDLTMFHFLTACGLEKRPTHGYGAWVLMALPYKAKALARVQAVRNAGIEIRQADMPDPVELANEIWRQRFVVQDGLPSVPEARIEQVCRHVQCGGRTFFAYKDGAHVGTVMGLPRTNTASSARFFRDPLVGTLTWIESYPHMRQAGLATALVHHLMESFRADGSVFFYYRGFGYGVKSHHVGMGMGRAYLRATCGWTRGE